MRSLITFRLGTESVVHRVHDLLSSWTCKRTKARSHVLSGLARVAESFEDRQIPAVGPGLRKRAKCSWQVSLVNQ